MEKQRDIAHKLMIIEAYFQHSTSYVKSFRQSLVSILNIIFTIQVVIVNCC